MPVDSSLSDTLVSAIYDAALDRARWPDALSLIGAAFRGVPTQLGIWNLEDGTIPLGIGVQFAPDAWEIAARFATPDTNPMLAIAMRTPLHVAVDQGAALGIDRFGSLDIHAALYRPQRQMPLLGTVVARSARVFGGLALMRPDHWPQADARDLALATRISRHVGRAVTLAGLFGYEDTHHAELEAALYHVDAPVMLLTADGRATWMNARAERMAAARDGLCVRDRKLAAVAAADDLRLASAIAQAARDREAVVTLRRDGRLDPVIVRLSPLLRTRGEACVLAQIDLPHAPLDFDENAAIERFGLTRAEARIACAVCARPGGLDEAAQRLGISINTVKTLLQRVYDKTGVRSRAGLATLFSRTLRGPAG